jgi:hypothetical protein
MMNRMNMLETIYHMNKFYDIQYHWELDDAEFIPKFVFQSDETITRVSKTKGKIHCRVYLFQDMLILANIDKKRKFSFKFPLI